MRRFFQKFNPRQAVLLSNIGKWQKFEMVDYEIGILSTENPEILQGIDQARKANIGAIEEIDEARYNELRAQKKTDHELTSTKPWREELSFNEAVQRDTAHRPTVPSAPGAEPADNKPRYGASSQIIRPNIRKTGA